MYYLSTRGKAREVLNLAFFLLLFLLLHFWKFSSSFFLSQGSPKDLPRVPLDSSYALRTFLGDGGSKQNIQQLSAFMLNSFEHFFSYSLFSKQSKFRFYFIQVNQFSSFLDSSKINAVYNFFGKSLRKLAFQKNENFRRDTSHYFV